MRFALRVVLALVLSIPAFAYEPNSTSPYTFNGTYSCVPCEIFSHTRLGDGFFHDSGCNQSGFPLYFCSCSIGYTNGQFLQQPILRVINDTTVELEYFAKNAYCNPPADTFTANEPNAIPYRISVVAINPQTLATIGTVHTVPPYWEHGKIEMTDMNPRCTMYRAVYQVMDASFTTYAVSSDIVGGTGSSSCAPIPDLGPCPNCNDGSEPTGGVSPGVGAPVNVGSGNVHFSIPLFSVDEPGGALDFAVTYNSLETNAGALGPGFTHPFAQSMLATNSGNIRVWRRPDGTRVVFARENHPGIGEYWRPIGPGETTGSVVLDSSAGRYKWTDLRGTVTEVDSTSGLWRKTTDRWGNTLTATYTGSNLTTLTDTLGRTWTFGYSGSLLTSITDGESNQWRFSYDGSNRLEKIFDPLHTSTTPWRQFTWTTYATGKSAVALVADDSGAVIEGHQYDTNGRATSSWSGPTTGGSAPSPGTNARDLVTLSYDSPTQTTVTTTIDSGVTSTTVYTLKVGSGRFLATSIVGNCGSCGVTEDAQTFTFDDENRVLTKTVGVDRTGSGGTDERVTSSFTYNANGMVLTATEAVGKSEEHTLTYAYTKTNWPSFITSITEESVAKPSSSKVTTMSWNSGETQLTATTSGYLRSTDSSPTTYSTITTYDAKHRPTQVDGPRTNQKTTWSYYSDTDTDLNRRGRLYQTSRYVTTSDALVTTFDDYNIYGAPGKETDANSVDVTRTFDARGRVLTITSVKPPSDSNEPPDYTRTMTFDSRDRMTSMVFPRGNGLRYVYEDGTNRPLEVIRIDDSGDEHERMLFTLNTVGHKTSEAAQDCGTPADPCSSWTTRRSDAFTYDSAGRLITTTHPDSSTIGYAYDSRGNMISVRDERHPSAANTLYGYDFRDRLTTVTQKRTIVSGSDVVTTYTYDDQDNIASATDPKSNTTTFAFDDFGRMQTQTSPVTGTTSNSYDAAGNNTSTTDANGSTTTKTFDLIGRELTASSSRTGVPTEDVIWTYDDDTVGNYGIGRLSSMEDPSGVTTYEYERRGLLRLDSNDGTGMGGYYTYDENGNRTLLGIAHYTFDYADRPLTADWMSTPVIEDAKYLPFGPLKELSYANGAIRTVAYDTRYRPTENKLMLSSTVIADYDYDHDAAGNVTELHDGQNSAYNRDFEYDDLNRLITADTGTALWGSGSYTYDAAGNITSSVLGSYSNLSFSYSGTTSKLTSVNSTSVTYDSAGNETADISARNLVAFDNAHMIYDGRGVRVKEYLGLFETSLPWQRVSHYTPGMRLLDYVYTHPAYYSSNSIVWFGNLPVAQMRSDDFGGLIPEGDTTYLRYTFSDHIGTPILQMIGSDVVWRVEYEPFGRIYEYRVGGEQEQRLRFPGQEAYEINVDYSEKTYNVFRWYRNTWARYTQADPAGLQAAGSAHGLNQLYAYANDNPIRFFDPLGLVATALCSSDQTKAINDAANKAKNSINAKCLGCKPNKVKAWKDKIDGTTYNCMSEGQESFLMSEGKLLGDTCAAGINLVGKETGKDVSFTMNGLNNHDTDGFSGCGCLEGLLLHEISHFMGFATSSEFPDDGAKLAHKCIKCAQDPASKK